MDYFKPKRADGRSYRDVAVDLLKTKVPNEVISYKALGEQLELTGTSAIQRVARDANKVLLEIYKIGLKNVPQVGYRILEAREHMIAANGHQSKADRAMVRALNFYEGTDLSAMTETERKLHHGQQMLAQAIYASHQHLDKRIKRVEDLLRGTKTIDPD